VDLICVSCKEDVEWFQGCSSLSRRAKSGSDASLANKSVYCQHAHEARIAKRMPEWAFDQEPLCNISTRMA